jgi:hypothetical protein
MTNKRAEILRWALTELPSARPLADPPPPTKDEYLRMLWREFCLETGRDPDYCCSSAEWALLYELWQERESCPLRVFLRAIKDTREGRRDLGEPKYRSVLYYRKSIQDAARMWRKALA